MAAPNLMFKSIGHIHTSTYECSGTPWRAENKNPAPPVFLGLSVQDRVGCVVTPETIFSELVYLAEG